MKDAKTDLTWEQVRTTLLWIALPLIAGILIAALIPQPVVGLLYVNTPIDGYTSKDILSQIEYARTHAEVRAVVLVLDSPGGTVADTEALYLELLKLRETRPVVASINSMAASGAYYLTAAADYAYAKPTSDVGNIGVIGYLPPVPTIYEGVISTGPYKLWGTPRDTYMRQIEMIKQGFYGAVKAGRGDRLNAGPEIILSGQIWPGSRALQLGLIDALGAQSDAVEKAASMAHISNYRVENLYTLSGLSQAVPFPMGFFAQTEEGVTLPYPSEPGIYMLYIPPMPVEQK